MRGHSVPAFAAIAVVFLVLVSVSAVFLTETSDAADSDYTGFYYDSLTAEGKTAYEIIVEGAAACEATVSTGILSSDTLLDALGAVYYDHQELFHLNINNCKAYPNGKINLSYTVSPSVYSEMIADIDSHVATISKKLESCTYDYEKVLTIHDSLVSGIKYTKDRANSHNIYGALVEGQCVCEGYARAMQYLCQINGIDCPVVSGTGINSSGSEGHMWNIIRISGSWYCLDVTWDDPLVNGSDSGKVHYDYFLVGTDTVTDGRKFTESHVTDSSLPALSPQPYHIRPGATVTYSLEGTVTASGDSLRFTTDAASIDAALDYLQNNGLAEVSFGEGKAKIGIDAIVLGKISAYMASKGASTISFGVTSSEEKVSVGFLDRENSVYRFSMYVGDTETKLSDISDGAKATLFIPFEASALDIIKALVFAWDVNGPMKPMASSSYDGTYVSVEVDSMDGAYIAGSTPMKDVPVLAIIIGTLVIILLIWFVFHRIRRHRQSRK
ncbi:Transglutaminase-like superfamily [Thermoplasmatales archaeon BRNA1]|nr:Transglutaminase-like superfamily [Thermoplasmatales archaeon BRNA1]